MGVPKETLENVILGRTVLEAFGCDNRSILEAASPDMTEK